MMKKIKIEIGPWSRTRSPTPTPRTPAPVMKEEKVERVEVEEAIYNTESTLSDSIEVTPRAKNKSEQKVETVEVEEAIYNTEATLSDSIEVTPRAIKLEKKVEAVKEEEAIYTEVTLSDSIEVTPHAIKPPSPISIRDESAAETCPLLPRPPSCRSPTSQFEYDDMNATHQTLAFGSLHKNHSHALLDDDKSISSEESLRKGSGGEPISSDSDGVSTHKKAEYTWFSEFVQKKGIDIGCSEFFDGIVEGEDFGFSEFVQKNISCSAFLDDIVKGEDFGVSEFVQKKGEDIGCTEFFDDVAKGEDFGVTEFVQKKGEDIGCTEFFDDVAKGEDFGVTEFVHKVFKGEDIGFSEFVEDILSPMECASDFMFCQLDSAFPDMVEAMDEILSSDLHCLIFQDEWEEEAGALILRNDKAEHKRKKEEGVEIVLRLCTDEQVEGGVGHGKEGVDEQGEDEEGGDAVVLDGQKDTKEVEVVLGRWPEQEMQAQLENASYSPEKGFVLRKDGRLPELSEDEVLIRVEATTISTRDCLERLRRDSNDELKDDVWVPGHEIVGHVVRAGMNAKFLVDKRVAALLPYGGGCSQYVCIHAKDAIVLPEEAGSNEMVALLSTSMTAYQCLESVVGIEPSEEGYVESEEEEDSEDVEKNAQEEDESKEEDDIEAEENPLVAEGQTRSSLLGKKVLIVGAGSPLGLALVDLARNAGSIVYALSHSVHFTAIREMGVNHWYRLSQKELWEEAWRGEMDLIIDTVGDSDTNDESFYKVMKTRGRLVRVNTTSCEKNYVPGREQDLTSKSDGITRRYYGAAEDMKGVSQGYYGRVISDNAIDYDIFHSFNDDKELFNEDLAYLHDLLQTGKISAKIFSRVGFDELEGVWEKVMEGETNGGVVVVSPWKTGFTMVRA
jgi:NADPH:quinone reductase-like Zn-dependent oxidoreductase